MTYEEREAVKFGVDAETWRWFDSQYKGIPEIAEGHVPTLHANRSLSGLMLSCSCGKRLHRTSGCNMAGMNYSALVCREKYLAHAAAEGR